MAHRLHHPARRTLVVFGALAALAAVRVRRSLRADRCSGPRRRPDCGHLDLSAKPALSRERGVMVVGSGKCLSQPRGGWTGRSPDCGFDWAHRFDDGARDDDRHIDGAARHPGRRDLRSAVPAPDHVIPLLCLAGLAGAANRSTDVLVDGSLSMTAYPLDLPIETVHSGGAAGTAPDPAGVTDM